MRPLHLHKLGFKLLPLSVDNTEVMPWTPIYEDPNFWSENKLTSEYSKFKNIATVFGKTHLKDSERRDLYLNGLDCDSEPVYKLLTTPIEEISDLRLQDLYSKFSVHPTTAKESLFEFLKEITVVVKTRKPFGLLTFWFSHAQYNHIGTIYCKAGHEFEIKTDKSLGHATLPPSTHRNDKTFRYSHIGRIDKIEIIDDLYNILLGLLKECLVSDPTNVNDTKNKSRHKQQATTTL